MPSISALSSIQGLPRPEKLQPLSQPDSSSVFSKILDQSVRTVSNAQDEAGASVEKFLSGEQEDPHNMLLAVQRADLTFEMFTQVRNKVISAYQEVMRMPE